MPKNLVRQSCCLLAVLSLVGITPGKAADIVWTNTAGGNWSTPANWSPNQVPTGVDTAVITNTGTYSVTNSANATVAGLSLGALSGLQTLRLTAGTLTVTNTTASSNSVISIAGGTLLSAGAFNSAGEVTETSGSWRLLAAGTLNLYNFTNGELRGGTLTVTNFNWTDGNLYSDVTGDKTIIPPGGALNFFGANERYLSYYAGTGRGLDNFGTWNWIGSGHLRGQNGAIVNNHGSVIVSGTAAANTQFRFGTVGAAPVWNNFGTFTKTSSTNYFYFNNVFLNNSGTMNVQTGPLSIYNTTATNNAGGALLVSAGATLENDNTSLTTFAPGSSLACADANAFRVLSGTVHLQTPNVSAPSFLIAGGTLYQQAANAVPQINQNAGTWRLAVTTTINSYNFTNGELRGGTLTVTNFNWIGGNMNSDVAGDKTIIPPGGVLNFPGSTDRVLSYYAGTGRGLDNYGTWNWTGEGDLRGQNAATVNNYGSVIVSATTGPNVQFDWAGTGAAPIWNNFGTFSRTAGTTFFYFDTVSLNNSGTIDIQTGTLSILNSTAVNNGTINVAGDQLQFSGSTATNNANISVAAGKLLTVEGGVLALNAPSFLSSPSHNSVRLISGSMHLATTSLITPSLWISGGTLYQHTNIVVAQINQSAGVLELRLPATLANYNLTNGELRGRDLTVTNFNWYDGNLNNRAPGESAAGAADRTIIPPGGVMNILGTADRGFSYYVGTGRGLDNHGTINWSAPIQLRGNNGAVVNNYGTVLVTGGSPNVQFDWFGSGAAPTWNNFGSFTRTTGSTTFHFDTTFLNNSGTMDIQSGTLSIYNTTATNLAGGLIQMSPGTVLVNENGSVTMLDGGSTLNSPDANSVRLPTGTIRIASTNINTPTIWISGGTLFQHTNIVVGTINQSAGALDLRVPAALANYNLTNGELRGRDLTVTNLNWYDGNMNNRAPGESGVGAADRTIIPAGGVANILGTADRGFSYHAGTGRGLDNHGTINWSAPIQLRGNNGTIVNNYGNVLVTGGSPNVQFDWFGNGAAPVWNNFGTLTRTTGNTLFYFDTAFLNNSGTMDIQTGTLSIYNTTATNLAGGAILLGADVTVLNDNGADTTLNPGSILVGNAPNTFRILSGVVRVRSTDLTLPSLWLAGGTLYHETNNVIPQVNQSAGVWRPLTPISVNTYNLTNGELRGADLTINNFNWQGGQLNADAPGSNTVTVSSSLNISGNTAKSLSYYVQPGRKLINNGTAVWGGVGITGQGAGTIANNGSMTVTNDVGLVWGGSGAVSVFENVGSYTKSAGTGTASFGSTAVTNNGTMAINSGGISFGTFVQTGGNAYLGTNFSVSSFARVEAGTLTGRGSVAGSFYNNGAVNPGASPGLVTAATFTNSPAATLNIELGGTTGAGTNYDQVRLTGAAALNGTMNVSLANNFAPSLSNSFTVMTFGSRSGIFPTITPPPGVTLDAAYSSTNLVLTVTALTNAPLLITSFPSNSTVYASDPASFFVGISGTTPISYQWLFNSNVIANATNALYTIPTTSATNAGTYSVLVTDGVGGTTNASAALTVLPFDGTIYWANTAGGNWNVAANWTPPRVPGPTNTAAIITNGNYTVTINSDAAVRNMLVGSTTGASTQTVHLLSGSTLALGGNSTFETNTIFQLNGLLQTTGGTNNWRGRIEWYSGTLSGSGRTIIGTNAEIYFTGSQVAKYVATNILENYGQFTYSPDSGIGSGQLLRFSGGAQLTNHSSGVINMKDNALQYTGSQTPRSYLVNYGIVRTTSPGVFSPSYISLEFINYGRLENYGYVYLSRGANFGEFFCNNGLAEISIFGDPNTGEYFSFEPGTILSGVGLNIACGGPVQWRAGNAIHAGRLAIASGSGGATYANAEFKVMANYTNTSQVSIARGALTIINPAVVTDLRSYVDSFVSFWSFGVTNAGTMYVDNLSHVVYGFGNGGRLIIRTNANFAGGSLHGSGNVRINIGANTTFSGGSVDGQSIQNFGSVTVSAATHLTGSAYFENKLGASTYFGGGDFRTGPATLANFGNISGFGGIYIPATNHSIVMADDPSNRTLALGDYRQLAGQTQLRGGNFSGLINLLGGTLDGAGSIGSVINGATVLPGNPLGTISATGGYTNLTGGIYQMQIAATNNYDRINVAGTAKLAGTLNVTFTNGFFPVTGSTYTAMTWTARSGVFDQILTPNSDFEILYTATNLLLRTANALPAVIINVGGGNTQLVCNPFTLTASGSDPDGTVTNIDLLMNGNVLTSSSGASAITSVEIDFPGTNVFVARARDDRGGLGFRTQEVVQVTSPLHVLTLGGVRSNGTFKICMLGEAGSNYLMLATTNIASPQTNWMQLGLMENTNGIWRYFDAGTLSNRSRRFYRALRQ